MVTQVSVRLVFFLCFVCGCLARILAGEHGGHLETGCPMEFKGRCKCGLVRYGPSQKMTYLTNCTDTEFQNYEMLHELPVETEVLIFTGNEFRDLPFNIFGQENSYQKLHTVDLSNNGIQTIKGKTFHSVSSVRKLILNDNDMYIVGKDNHPRMFSNFENLEELHLKNAFSEKEPPAQYLDNLVATFRESDLIHLKILDLSDNEITAIPDSEMFCHLPALEELRLGNNRLHDVTFDLSCMEHLDLLDLHENSIHTLSNATLKRFKEVPGMKLNLSHNPFYCDCHMVQMYEWLQQTTLEITDRESYHCAHGFPPNNIGKPFTALTRDDLLCPLIMDSFDGHLHASYVVLTLIIVIFAVVLGILLFRFRKQFGKMTSNCTEPIRNKMQYSSLDKRGEAEMEV